MGQRRWKRLTNAFSKKWENLWAAYCLHFAYYNLRRIHKTIRVTPAMEIKMIGGHIHIATITPDAGFQWVVPPKMSG